VQLTVHEAAKCLRVPENTIHRWIRDRGLPAVKFNEQYRLNQVDLLVWAQANQVAFDPECLAAREPSLPDLTDALARGGIHRDLPGNDRHEVIRAVVERLPLTAGLDRPLLAQMLDVQKALGVTAIGGGFAIPHMRGPVVLPLGQPVLALGLLAHPVDFGAPDGKPVHSLFTLVTPTIRVHLHLLARLSFALGCGFGERVSERADDDAILAALRAAEQAAARARP